MTSWLPVVGYEGLYEVSDRGQVRSLDRAVIDKNGRIRNLHGRLLHPTTEDSGYLKVCLSRNGKARSQRIHILVLEAFSGVRKAEEGLHGKGGPQDNRWPENLYWGSHKQNMEDKLRDGTQTHGEHHHTAKLSKMQVLEIRADISGRTHEQVAADYRVCRSTITLIKSGARWKKD